MSKPLGVSGLSKIIKKSVADAPQRKLKLLPKGEHAIFYSKSKDIPDLGHNCPPNWRKVLSNFYFPPEPLEAFGLRFHTVEHAFHAAKASCSNKPSLAAEFAVGGKVPKDPLSAKLAGGRKGFERKGATLDTDLWNKHRDERQWEALIARAKVDPLFRSVLHETKKRDLTLVHFERGGAKAYWGAVVKEGQVVGRNRLGEMLMKLRDELAES